MAGSTFAFLDKGAVVEVANGAMLKYRFVQMGTTSVQHVITVSASGGTAKNVLGISQEDIDAAKVATGKATINVRMFGISKVIAGAAVTAPDYVMSDASGRAIAATTGLMVRGLALTSATAAGDYIDVFVFPPSGGRLLP
jgi:hypothetical protein